MSQPAPADSARRQHWYGQAQTFAKLDCCLLNLLPWEDRDLAKLPVDLQKLLRPKLDELVRDACADEIKLEHPETVQRLNAAIWNFLKPWKREEAVRVQGPA